MNPAFVGVRGLSSLAKDHCTSVKDCYTLNGLTMYQARPTKSRPGLCLSGLV
jgi:hypothetical protein